MKNLLCGWFGHRLEATVKGHSHGAEYMRVSGAIQIDGIDRHHAPIFAECARCGEEFVAGKIHIPAEYVEHSKKLDKIKTAIFDYHQALDWAQWRAENPKIVVKLKALS